MDSIFPPFEPDPPKGRRIRLRRVPVRMLIPNIVTLLALCAGLTAIRLGMDGRFELAIIAILVAAVLDALDGRVARFLKSTSRFGAELDSLSDFLSFGVAPALLLYLWVLDELGNIGWIAGLVFAIAAALRLARFNVSLDDPAKPAWQANFFVGMPAPAGAIVVLLPIYLVPVGLPKLPAIVVLLYCLTIAFFLVSRLPTFSGKRLGRRISPEMVLPLFVASVLFVALLVSFTWHVLTVGTLIYLCCLPLGYVYYRRAERGYAAPSGPD